MQIGPGRGDAPSVYVFTCPATSWLTLLLLSFPVTAKGTFLGMATSRRLRDGCTLDAGTGFTTALKSSAKLLGRNSFFGDALPATRLLGDRFLASSSLLDHVAPDERRGDVFDLLSGCIFENIGVFFFGSLLLWVPDGPGRDFIFLTMPDRFGFGFDVRPVRPGGAPRSDANWLAPGLTVLVMLIAADMRRPCPRGIGGGADARRGVCVAFRADCGGVATPNGVRDLTPDDGCFPDVAARSARSAAVFLSATSCNSRYKSSTSACTSRDHERMLSMHVWRPFATPAPKCITSVPFFNVPGVDTFVHPERGYVVPLPDLPDPRVTFTLAACALYAMSAPYSLLSVPFPFTRARNEKLRFAFRRSGAGPNPSSSPSMLRTLHSDCVSAGWQTQAAVGRLKRRRGLVTVEDVGVPDAQGFGCDCGKVFGYHGKGGRGTSFSNNCPWLTKGKFW